jgi:beta-lactamase class A
MQAGWAAVALVLAGAAAAPARSGTLERRIEARLRTFPGTLGVAAIALDGGETVAVNADTRFPTASVIKVPVMAAVFQQIADGRLRKDQVLTLKEEEKVGGSGVLHSLRAGAQLSVADLLYLMIAVSDNTATNMLVGLAGTRNVDDLMAASGFPLTRLYRPTFRGGKADVFPEEEKRFGLGSTTPREMARLLEKIARGQMVSPSASAEMVALLEKQQDRDMIPRRLPEVDGVVVASKSGTDSRTGADGKEGAIRNDVAIVSTPQGRYVVAIFTQGVSDLRWGVDNEALVTGAEISRWVFDHFTQAAGDRSGAQPH